MSPMQSQLCITIITIITTITIITIIMCGLVTQGKEEAEFQVANIGEEKGGGRGDQEEISDKSKIIIIVMILIMIMIILIMIMIILMMISMMILMVIIGDSPMQWGE